MVRVSVECEVKLRTTLHFLVTLAELVHIRKKRGQSPLIVAEVPW